MESGFCIRKYLSLLLSYPPQTNKNPSYYDLSGNGCVDLFVSMGNWCLSSIWSLGSASGCVCVITFPAHLILGLARNCMIT